MKRIKILAVDDDITFLESLKKVLISQEYKVDTLSVSSDVFQALFKNNYDVLLLDIHMPGISGIDILKKVIIERPHMPVIIISGQSTIKIAVEAMKLGAYDFIEKGSDTTRLNTILKNAIASKELKETTDRLISEISENYKMVGESPQLKQICNEIDLISKSNSKVLITGESGTGKELIAWAVHLQSNRKEKPFIRINCASIPHELLESELFGYIKGSFTGANNSKIGKFEAAEGGTLLLDEIGEMDLLLQAKVLRVLEENEIEVIGETTPRKINVRVIAATNQDLNINIEKGTFRKDLFYRLNVCRIHIPPLRERKEDILPIANLFIEKFNNEYNKQIKSITTQAVTLLLNHTWEGNVRELRNLIENVILFTNKDKIELDELITAINRLNINKVNHFENSNGIKYLHDAKEEFERCYLIKALNKCHGKINETAETLGIDRTNLFKKLQKHGIK